MSCTTMISTLLICMVVMTTLVTAMPSFRRTSEIEDEEKVTYDKLKRVLLARLTKDNSVKRAFADCSGNVQCMVWGKRAFMEGEDTYKRIGSKIEGKEKEIYDLAKKVLLAKLTKDNSVKRALTDCSGNVQCMVWGKRAIMESEDAHKDLEVILID